MFAQQFIDPLADSAVIPARRAEKGGTFWPRSLQRSEKDFPQARRGGLFRKVVHKVFSQPCANT
jgi:hypothetical protein